MFRKQPRVAKIYLDELIGFLLQPNKDREEVSMCKQHCSHYSLLSDMTCDGDTTPRMKASSRYHPKLVAAVAALYCAHQ
jgi:hypothetical protein